MLEQALIIALARLIEAQALAHAWQWQWQIIRRLCLISLPASSDCASLCICSRAVLARLRRGVRSPVPLNAAIPVLCSAITDRVCQYSWTELDIVAVDPVVLLESDYNLLRQQLVLRIS